MIQGGARLISACTLLALALVLSGCQSPLDWLSERAPRASTVAARVPLKNGEMLFYRYKQGVFCGEGFSYGRDGGGAQLRCDRVGGLTFAGHGLADLSVLYGRVEVPGVTTVVLTLDSGEEITATLGDGMWYMIFPGQATFPRPTKIEALDEAGKIVASIP